MRYETNRSERFGARGAAGADDFAPLFDQLGRPIDAGAVAEGMRSLALWLGSPRQRWLTRADH